MDKVICNHCKNELTVENIKSIKNINTVKGLALVECKECSNVTEVSNAIAFKYLEYKQLQNREKIYSFEEIDYLLKELSVIDREKVRNCKFKVSEQSPDDDSDDVYYYITVFNNNTEIGNIGMIYHSNTTWDLELNEEIKYGEPSYSYTMKLNEQQTYNKILQELEVYKYLTKEQKQQLEEYTFTNESKLENAFFDGYTIWEYTADIIKDKNKIGKLTVTCGNKHGDIISLMSAIAPEYEYTVKIEIDNKDINYIGLYKDYIECPNCHNKVLGNYWLNVKYQGHNNYGDYEEDICTGECPICRETIETNELVIYVNSMEAEKIELQQYYKVIENFGYDSSPFEDCEYCDTCVADELKYIKSALESLTDILNVKYLYNMNNIKAIQSNKIYNYNSSVITNIFHNTSYADFDINSIKDCKFKVLDCSVLNDIVEEDTFDTPIISLLLQVIRNNKILGYIKVEQQYPLDKKFIMFKVKKDSNKRLVELCNAYTNMYNNKEDTTIMLSKSKTDGFNAPVCKKCGQLFCDCNLRCKVCGQLFCMHKR